MTTEFNLDAAIEELTALRDHDNGTAMAAREIKSAAIRVAAVAEKAVVERLPDMADREMQRAEAVANHLNPLFEQILRPFLKPVK